LKKKSRSAFSSNSSENPKRGESEDIGLEYKNLENQHLEKKHQWEDDDVTIIRYAKHKIVEPDVQPSVKLVGEPDTISANKPDNYPAVEPTAEFSTIQNVDALSTSESNDCGDHVSKKRKLKSTLPSRLSSIIFKSDHLKEVDEGTAPPPLSNSTAGQVEELEDHEMNNDSVIARRSSLPPIKIKKRTEQPGPITIEKNSKPRSRTVSKDKARTCLYFKKGDCKFGSKCKNSHVINLLEDHDRETTPTTDSALQAGQTESLHPQKEKSFNAKEALDDYKADRRALKRSHRNSKHGPFSSSSSSSYSSYSRPPIDYSRPPLGYSRPPSSHPQHFQYDERLYFGPTSQLSSYYNSRADPRVYDSRFQISRSHSEPHLESSSFDSRAASFDDHQIPKRDSAYHNHVVKVAEPETPRTFNPKKTCGACGSMNEQNWFNLKGRDLCKNCWLKERKK
jgi:hypothetical protein